MRRADRRLTFAEASLRRAGGYEEEDLILLLLPHEKEMRRSEVKCPCERRGMVGSDWT